MEATNPPKGKKSKKELLQLIEQGKQRAKLKGSAAPVPLPAQLAAAPPVRILPLHPDRIPGSDAWFALEKEAQSESLKVALKEFRHEKSRFPLRECRCKAKKCPPPPVDPSSNQSKAYHNLQELFSKLQPLPSKSPKLETILKHLIKYWTCRKNMGRLKEERLVYYTCTMMFRFHEVIKPTTPGQIPVLPMALPVLPGMLPAPPSQTLSSLPPALDEAKKRLIQEGVNEIIAAIKDSPLKSCFCHSLLCLQPALAASKAHHVLIRIYSVVLEQSCMPKPEYWKGLVSYLLMCWLCKENRNTIEHEKLVKYTSILEIKLHSMFLKYDGTAVAEDSISLVKAQEYWDIQKEKLKLEVKKKSPSTVSSSKETPKLSSTRVELETEFSHPAQIGSMFLSLIGEKEQQRRIEAGVQAIIASSKEKPEIECHCSDQRCRQPVSEDSKAHLVLANMFNVVVQQHSCMPNSVNWQDLLGYLLKCSLCRKNRGKLDSDRLAYYSLCLELKVYYLIEKCCGAEVAAESISMVKAQEHWNECDKVTDPDPEEEDLERRNEEPNEGPVETKGKPVEKDAKVSIIGSQTTLPTDSSASTTNATLISTSDSSEVSPADRLSAIQDRLLNYGQHLPQDNAHLLSTIEKSLKVLEKIVLPAEMFNAMHEGAPALVRVPFKPLVDLSGRKLLKAKRTEASMLTPPAVESAWSKEAAPKKSEQEVTNAPEMDQCKSFNLWSGQEPFEGLSRTRHGSFNFDSYSKPVLPQRRSSFHCTLPPARPLQTQSEQEVIKAAEDFIQNHREFFNRQQLVSDVHNDSQAGLQMPGTSSDFQKTSRDFLAPASDLQATSSRDLQATSSVFVDEDSTTSLTIPAIGCETRAARRASESDSIAARGGSISISLDSECIVLSKGPLSKKSRNSSSGDSEFTVLSEGPSKNSSLDSEFRVVSEGLSVNKSSLGDSDFIVLSEEPLKSSSGDSDFIVLPQGPLDKPSSGDYEYTVLSEEPLGNKSSSLDSEFMVLPERLSKNSSLDSEFVMVSEGLSGNKSSSGASDFVMLPEGPSKDSSLDSEFIMVPEGPLCNKSSSDDSDFIVIPEGGSSSGNSEFTVLSEEPLGNNPNNIDGLSTSLQKLEKLVEQVARRSEMSHSQAFTQSLASLNREELVFAMDSETTKRPIDVLLAAPLSPRKDEEIAFCMETPNDKRSSPLDITEPLLNEEEITSSMDSNSSNRSADDFAEYVLSDQSEFVEPKEVSVDDDFILLDQLPEACESQVDLEATPVKVADTTPEFVDPAIVMSVKQSEAKKVEHDWMNMDQFFAMAKRV